MRRRGIMSLGAVLAIALYMTSCTSGSRTEPTSAASPSVPTTSTRTSPAPPTPVSTGPTTSARALACPFVAQDFVHRTIGERLGRITVQWSGGRAVGCRFYALQKGSLHRSEHLPGSHTPSLEITMQRYRNATDAHNAFVLRAEKGTNATRVALGGGVLGLCFQTDFFAPDKGRDWACAVNRNETEIVAQSVDTTGTFNTVAVLRKVLDAHAS